ncbi:MAG: hypothetical protein Q4E11_07145 [Corynebacterium sp.]|uniref:hypothetical protein n=1 Tax=Corynebacterium sp. TaxID=1720 RepID=UPI0026DA963E|nr:hypothetical protein [Corynebacterium sp.]MDO5030346.1 hypothetical protein [Corynebacterium sp.]
MANKTGDNTRKQLIAILVLLVLIILALALFMFVKVSGGRGGDSATGAQADSSVSSSAGAGAGAESGTGASGSAAPGSAPGEGNDQDDGPNPTAGQETAGPGSGSQSEAPSSNSQDSSTDSDGQKISGNVRVFQTDEEMAAFQGVENPNKESNYDGGPYTIVVLDSPQQITAQSSGSAGQQSTRQATMVKIPNGTASDGEHVTLDAPPSSLWWPSDAGLPMGQPSMQ